MAVPTVAAGDEVRSVDHNWLAGAINGSSDDYGTPFNLYRYNSASGFAVTSGNQDATGLIHLFQYGPVDSPTEAARITRQGIIAKLRDKGGWAFNLDAHAPNGATINNSSGATATTNTDAAWAAVFNAVSAVGGGMVILGTGTYLAPTSAVTNWPDNMIIVGAGIAGTTIIHPNASAKEPIFYFGRSNCGVAYLTVEGNRTENNNVDTGFNSCEVSLDGTNCWAFKIRVINFNKRGISVSGAGISVIDCKVGLSSPVTSYTALNAGTASGNPAVDDGHDYGGLYGISTAGVTGEQDILVMGNEVYGLRSAGIFVGGTRIKIIGNSVYNCHRYDFPTGVGGGQLAVAPTGPGATGRSTYVVIANNTIGTTQINGLASGMEVNAADYVTIADNHINGTPTGGGVGLLTGITLDQACSHVSITGGSIINCKRGLNIGSTAGLPCIWFGVSNVSFSGNGASPWSAGGSAIYIDGSGGTIDFFSIMGCRFNGNTANLITTGTIGTSWEAWGNLESNGIPVPQRAARIVYIGDDSNSGMTLGLTINQGAADNQILAFKSSDMAHGMTSVVENDTYGYFIKASATDGGLQMVGVAETAQAIVLAGLVTTVNSTHSTSGQGAVTIAASKDNSAGSITTLGSTNNLLAVTDNGTARFFLDASGNSYQDVGTAWTNFDTHDDVAVLNSLSHELAREGNPISDEFGRFLTVSRDALERAGVVTFNDGPSGDGHAFVNMSRLLMLTVGAVRQVGLEIATMRDEMRAITAGADRAR